VGACAGPEYEKSYYQEPDSYGYEGYNSYNRPYDTDYYREHPLDPNAGEPGTHTDGHRNPPIVKGPKKCDFKHGDNINLCLQELSRDPPGYIVSPDVTLVPVASFT
jgi:hypothetical protein